MRRATTLLGVVTVTAAAVAGCSTPPETDAGAEWEGAEAAMAAYVEAIETADLATATAMTADAALELPGDAGDADVTAALPAAEPMTDAWISFVGADHTVDEDGDGIDADDTETTDVTWWTVSYDVGGTAGADEVRLTLTGEDASDPGAWTVTDGLLVEAVVYAEDSTVDAFTVGGTTEVLVGTAGAYSIWGYPGVYAASATLAESVEGDVVTEVEVPIGVEPSLRWNETLPVLGT